MIHADSGWVLATDGRSAGRCTFGAGAGSVSRTRCEAWREARPDAGAEAKIRFTSVGGKLVAKARMPTLGRCPPTALGTVSQYWLSALSEGLSQIVSGVACATELIRHASAAGRTTRTTMRERLTIPVSDPCQW
jgi:hypothetical protein